MSVITTKRQVEDCPCGCQRQVPHLFGEIRRDSSSLVFRAYLMQDTKDKPNLWLMLVTGPWGDDPRDCAIVVQAISEPKGVRAYLTEQKQSPWKDIRIEELRFLNRDEVLLQDGGKDWVFNIFDHFIEEQDEVQAFLKNM